MVHLEEIEDECPPKTRAQMLQKRFQGLLTNIIKDTQDTFSSLMDDLDTAGTGPLRKLPSLLQQSTERFHCQMARKSWKLPKPGEGRGNGGNPSGDHDQGCGSSYETTTISSSDLDEYEASERLKSLIEQELRSRKEIVRDRQNLQYPKTTQEAIWSLDDEYPSSSESSSNSNSKTNPDSSVLEDFVDHDKYISSSQRLNSLIHDELNRMNIKVEEPKAKHQAPRHGWVRSFSPINFSPRPQNWTGSSRTKVAAENSEST